jgi:hypothetical protein
MAQITPTCAALVCLDKEGSDVRKDERCVLFISNFQYTTSFGFHWGKAQSNWDVIEKYLRASKGPTQEGLAPMCCTH